MEDILLRVGADGGDITISSYGISGMFFFKLERTETFFEAQSKSLTFLNLNEAWSCLKKLYPNWYQLYLIKISALMIEFVKEDYLIAKDKNEYTMDKWLQQLIGKDIGF